VSWLWDGAFVGVIIASWSGGMTRQVELYMWRGRTKNCIDIVIILMGFNQPHH
jgi:hypothetical protein